jgi:uracil-DNA glycosylase
VAEPLLPLLQEIRACRLCVDAPKGRPLPHEPRPVLRAAASARIAIYGQAPGTRVHLSGMPFTDPSGDRLRSWMGVTSDEFYDEARIAIVPMGFCFPGLDAKGADRPPRRECATHWRAKLITALPNVELALLVGTYAQRWHLPDPQQPGMTDTVRDWRRLIGREDAGVHYLPLPHPSWRNNAWIKKNAWFEDELLPVVRALVRQRLTSPKNTKPRRA